jgi:hypothetical protein
VAAGLDAGLGQFAPPAGLDAVGGFPDAADVVARSAAGSESPAWQPVIRARSQATASNLRAVAPVIANSRQRFGTTL